ncbi:hypothetical protein [Nocardioides sp. Arc9.136]|uniref:hypothetical protein n=1 Tax=Nocardioides sp. Arc9.136 TaxID=2996826 RepID=UPI00266548DA|nr:hypothetical protein [Nocardioides sp. Arc9.136]WKN47349.1 hypothetical protein OSR43_15080 [Nocardioides sp. Arc9.136]
MTRTPHGTPLDGPRGPRRPGRLVATLVAAALTLGATACSGDGAPDAERGGHRQAALVRAEAGSVPTTTTVTEVTGRLPAARRARLKKDVARVVDGWLDAAYVGGDFPREGGFRQAFPGFSSGAKDEARRDLRLMTNVGLAGRIDGVDVRRRELRLDVLAVRGRPVGVTARVLLGFTTSGQVERRDRVQGRLYLARREGAWQVFGYDVSRGRS